MGCDAIIGMCDLSNYNDRIIRFDRLESHSNLLKFYCFNAYIDMAMNIHVTVRFLQLRKEHLNQKRRGYISVKQKNDAPILYTVLTICAFLSLVFSGIKPIIDFGLMMTLGLLVSLLITFLLLPSLINLLSLENEIGIKDTEKSYITSSLGSFAKNNQFIIFGSTSS